MLINYMWPFLYKSTIGEIRYKIVLLKLINFSCSSKAWFTLRHKHKHKHRRKHNECSHLLHKHKEIDIHKRNELQNEAVGVLDELRFQNGGRRRNSPAAIARCSLTSNDTNCFCNIFPAKLFFICILEIIWAFVVEAGMITNCLGKFLMQNSILGRHFGPWSSTGPGCWKPG